MHRESMYSTLMKDKKDLKLRSTQAVAVCLNQLERLFMTIFQAFE